ncbi:MULTISPECIES: FtsK/SpoIIIE domain-containing protein [Micrococcaceae]|uniref:FtsK/SpoIIIE domain-containing protein n=1 Tax=Micrococcaceae TaxID=1268 RepID=UPI00047B2BC9|nr:MULTISPECIES: FtsK/SpoIIIE domain-containing protein [Micrococcaceae]
MTLECTLVRGPAAADSSAPEELTIKVPAGTSGTRLQSILGEERGTGPLEVDGQDISEMTVGRPPLVSGAIIVDGPAPRQAAAPLPLPLPLLLLVHSGPSAGAVFRIHRGRFRIGRGTAEISLPDPGMSREHAVLDVSSTAMTLSREGAGNPTFVDGRPVRQAAVTSQSRILCGNTVFSVTTETSLLPQISKDAGRSVEEPLEVAHAGRQGNRAAIILTAILPLIAGIGLAVATGMWMYLGFTAISALTLLVPFIAGRKNRRDCAAAVARAAQEDLVRRQRCSPSAAELAVMASGGSTAAAPDARSAPAEPGSSSFQPPGRLAGAPVLVEPGTWIRLGTANAMANIRLAPDDPTFNAPEIGSAAVTLDPELPTVVLDGPHHHVDSLLRFMMMQMAAFPGAAQTPVVVLGSVGRLPLSARFLPGVTLATTYEAALASIRRPVSGTRGLLVIIEHTASEDKNSLKLVLGAAERNGWQVVLCGPSDERSGPLIKLSHSGTKGTLEVAGERRNFVPDLVPMGVFDAFCRGMSSQGRHQGAVPQQSVPEQCALAALLPFGTRRVLLRWEGNAKVPGLAAVLGQDRHGPLTFDFKRDGPHLLVAGTTGSGKSELLRTLVASMALTYSPEHTTFLFIDFKGGSGLRPLAGLPHCVGLLTDLGRHHLDRALTSLRSEIRYREELFAAAEVTDLDQYHRAAADNYPAIPHLVLVIDEFRMLIEEAPGALRELMRVATIGRSLGIHLVMATQRPQGALTADIRANVASSIALRVQSEAESTDIINSKVAASIPADIPGRAYLVRASSVPEEFQSASLAVPHGTLVTGGPGVGVPRLVHATTLVLNGGPLQQSPLPDPLRDQADSIADEGVRQLLAAVKDAWHRHGGSLPRQPVAAPLPSAIPWAEVLFPVPDTKLPVHRDATSAIPARIETEPWSIGPLAWVDKPTRQVVETLQWSPTKDGHLAMIGSPTSGMHSCFRAVSAMLATQGSQPHSYVLDGAGILGDVLGQREVGALAGLHQLPLAARVLKRFAGEMDRRRNISESAKTDDPLALIITGWCSWATAFRAGPSAWAESLLQDIVRDGRSLGITVLICGERELVGARFFAAIQNRAYFPLGSTEEARFHWPRLPEVEPNPGRAIATGNFVDGDVVVSQFLDAPEAGPWPFAHLPLKKPPFRLRPLPDRLDEQEFCDGFKESGITVRSAGGISDGALWIGVGGDEALPVSLPLRLKGSSIILGGARSGKSTALASLRRLNPAVSWVEPPVGTSPDCFWSTTAQEVENLDPQSILLVDDADSLGTHGRQAITALSGKVRGIVMTATPGPALIQQLPLARELQTARMGLVLAPGSPHDAELLGVRLETERPMRPGRGYVVEGGDILPFQAVLTSGVPAIGDFCSPTEAH